MIIVLDKQLSKTEIQQIKEKIKAYHLRSIRIPSDQRHLLGLVGDLSLLTPQDFATLPGVVEVIPLNQPYQLANRAYHPQNSEVKVGPHTVGGKNLTIIAGPCSVEDEETTIQIAQRVKAAGANILRGGAFKPRSSPYSFQGLGMKALDYLEKARQLTALPICTELMSVQDVDEFAERVDLIQIGARNMQNYDLLKAVGRTQTPVLLKRGLSASYEEWLLAAEYILSAGNPHVILCERGIRTFENETRNCLDIQAVPVVKKFSHLPILVDPSHAAGVRDYIPASSRAAIAAGADGLIVECHPHPDQAWSDGQQSLNPEEFQSLMEEVEKIARVMDRPIGARE